MSPKVLSNISMMPEPAVESIKKNFPSRLVTIDSHTAGEATRLILPGTLSIPGKTMRAKRNHFMQHLDHIRLRLTHEPRGHRGTLAAAVTEPVTQGAHFGLIYMDARRYPFLCGHATMGAVMTLIETEILQTTDPETEFIVDTPSGPMKTRATIQNDRVASVALRMVPSFVYKENETLKIAGTDPLKLATVCVGGFFAMVCADQVGIDLIPQNSSKLIELGMSIIEAANRQLSVHHPTRPEANTVDVTEFYDPAGDAMKKGRSIVIYGEGHMDRSPCGTGTAAKMTLLHSRGKLGLNETYTNTGPLGTTFQGCLLDETRVGDLKAVVAEIRGQAQITGIHEFVLDERDPFPIGFML